MIKAIRANIGIIIAFVGFVLLCIITFGDIGDFITEAYWQNVKTNIMTIGITSTALTLIQTSIKQALAEQALQAGMNTDETIAAFNTHKEKIARSTERMSYAPYFLQAYNRRHTELKKHEFLIDNNYTSEKALLESNNKRIIRKYNKIIVLITMARIKWTTCDVVYNKYGQIVTLQEHRQRRIVKAALSSMIFMFGLTLLTKGLFEGAGEPLSQKFIKLLTYTLSIAIGSINSAIKEYEKGKYGVPADLREINEIWDEFNDWPIPEWAVNEVKNLNKNKEEVKDEKAKDISTTRDLQSEQKEEQDIQVDESNNLLRVSSINTDIHVSNDRELDRQYNEHIEYVE